MLMTLISIILAVIATLHIQWFHGLIDFSFLTWLMILSGTAALITVPLIRAISLIPLQQLQSHFISRIIELFRRDHWIRLNTFFLLLFPLSSFSLSLFLLNTDFPYKEIVFAIWLITLGVFLDFIRHDFKRTIQLLDPYQVIHLIGKEAKKAAVDEKDEFLWSSIDTLSEVSLQAVEKNRIALATEALTQFPPIMHIFFESAKSISHVTQDQKIEKETGRDEASYTVFYVVQRLQSINERALRHHLESVCSQIIVVLGKIIIYGARFDLSMVTFPTPFIGKFAVQALAHHYTEVANIATSTLLEIAKTIVTEIDLTYAELEEPFTAIINSLDAIAKETFRKDKTVNIPIISQPLRDLKHLFENEKVANHRDTPVIMQRINNALAEFDALEQVLRTLPPLSNFGNEPSS